MNGATIFNFYQDSTVDRVTSGLYGSQEEQGTFEFFDPDSVRIEFPGVAGPTNLILDVSFVGERMVLTQTSGESEEYERES